MNHLSRDDIQGDYKIIGTLSKAFLGFFLSLGLILLLSHYVQIVISETDSHPKHYFLHLPFYKPSLNDYTILYSEWYGKPIIKQIVAVEGDKIWYDEHHCLWINQKKIGVPSSTSRDNKVLTPIKAQIIPKDFVFVYSEHPLSFDSRYQELGLISLSSIQGKVVPLR